MPIITISRDSYSQGEKIAEKVAQILGYRCIGPEIIQHACDCLAVPITKIEKALVEPSGILDRIVSKKEQYLAMFRAVFFEYMIQDNVVYHGLAGHVFLVDVPNVIKVRVVADIEDRANEKMKDQHLSYDSAMKRLSREDRERSKWTQQLYDRDNHDPRLYDIYLNLHNISLDAAVAIIVGATRVSTNGHAGIMKQKLKDMALAAKIEARLLEVFPEVEAFAKNGEVFVKIGGSIVQEDRIVRKANEIVSEIEGAGSARIGLSPSGHVPF